MNLEEKIASIVRMHGAEYYDSEIVSENGNRIFRVYITKEGGVDLELCADISVELSPFLDVHPPMQEAYYLEVSSPGIERELKKASHFMKSIGEKVRVKLRNGEKLKGDILSADENGISIDRDGERVDIDYSEIKKARTCFDW